MRTELQPLFSPAARYPSRIAERSARARAFLGRELAAGPVAEAVVVAHAASAGISELTLAVARTALAVDVVRGHDGGRVWSLPRSAGPSHG